MKMPHPIGQGEASKSLSGDSKPNVKHETPAGQERIGMSEIRPIVADVLNDLAEIAPAISDALTDLKHE